MQGVSPWPLVLDHMQAVSGLNQKIFLIPATCFHPSFDTFTLRTETEIQFWKSRSTEHLQCRLRQTSDGGRWPQRDAKSLQFNKPIHFTGSREGRTKRSLYDQDYTRLLYSCLCWGSHLFKTTTTNISKAQWPHLASWNQSVENSFATLLTVAQTQNTLGWRRGTLSLLPFSAPGSAPLYFIWIPFQSQLFLLCENLRAGAQSIMNAKPEVQQ